MSNVHFQGSIWYNLDIALRNIDNIYKEELDALGLAIIEWYLLQILYEQDGQMASSLAKAVGRPATSFTPILDKLANKDLIERRPHPVDRRGVLIYLTPKGRNLRQPVQASLERIEAKVCKKLSLKDFDGYQHIISELQTMTA